MPMNQAVFEAFRAAAIAGNAGDMQTSRGLSASEALDMSAAEFDRLAPSGLVTPGHYFFSIGADGEAEPVGYLWFAAIDQDRRRIGYLYEIRVHPPFRRQGHATGALRAIEALARDLGLAELRLHAFGHNLAAQALYRKLGFEPISIVMRRALDVHSSA